MVTWPFFFLGAVEPPYILVGHSLGAFDAQLYAHTFPQDVISLMLIDPFSDQLVHIEDGLYLEYLLHDFSSKLQMKSYGSLLGVNRLMTTLDFFPGAEIANKLPKIEQQMMKRDWNRYQYWQSCIREVQSAVESLRQFANSNRKFALHPESTRLVVFQRPGEQLTRLSASWATNQQYFIDQLPREHIIKLPAYPNLGDAEVANEVADEIRRLFGASRKEDRQNWVYVTSQGAEGHVDESGQAHSHSHGHSHESYGEGVGEFCAHTGHLH